MRIPVADRAKMVAVRLSAPRVIARLESIEISKLRAEARMRAVVRSGARLLVEPA
jgi:hypothetical protein